MLWITYIMYSEEHTYAIKFFGNGWLTGFGVTMGFFYLIFLVGIFVGMVDHQTYWSEAVEMNLNAGNSLDIDNPNESCSSVKLEIIQLEDDDIKVEIHGYSNNRHSSEFAKFTCYQPECIFYFSPIYISDHATSNGYDHNNFKYTISTESDIFIKYSLNNSCVGWDMGALFSFLALGTIFLFLGPGIIIMGIGICVSISLKQFLKSRKSKAVETPC